MGRAAFCYPVSNYQILSLMQRIPREGGYFEKEVGWVSGSHAKRGNLSQWLSKSLSGPGGNLGACFTQLHGLWKKVHWHMTGKSSLK